jgi:hypothetical protein
MIFAFAELISTKAKMTQENALQPTFFSSTFSFSSPSSSGENRMLVPKESFWKNCLLFLGFFFLSCGCIFLFRSSARATPLDLDDLPAVSSHARLGRKLVKKVKEVKEDWMAAELEDRVAVEKQKNLAIIKETDKKIQKQLNTSSWVGRVGADAAPEGTNPWNLAQYFPGGDVKTRVSVEANATGLIPKARVSLQGRSPRPPMAGFIEGLGSYTFVHPQKKPIARVWGKDLGSTAQLSDSLSSLKSQRIENERIEESLQKDSHSAFVRYEGRFYNHNPIDAYFAVEGRWEWQSGCFKVLGGGGIKADTNQAYPRLLERQTWSAGIEIAFPK